MEFSRKCWIGCLAAYNYGDCVYFNNMNETPNEHHNNFILNQIPDFHITSPFKFCDDRFESLTKLSVDNLYKMDEITCPKNGPFITSQCMEQKKGKMETY